MLIAPQKQLARAQADRVPLVVVLGQDEHDNGTVKLRRMFYGSEGKERADATVARGDLVAEVRRELAEAGTAREKTRALLFS